MRLYDEVIADWNRTIAEANPKNLTVDPDHIWPDATGANMVLRSDMAYELGGSEENLTAIGGTAVTDDRALVAEDEIILVGPDLPEIKTDMPYARLSIVRVNEEAMGEGNKLYNAIKKIDFVRYHTAPEGFMMRVSAVRERESVRISKSAIEGGMNFEKVGNLMLRAYHENPNVEAVKLIFITDPHFREFDALKKGIKQSEDITKTIDHMMKNVIMDCKACSLQEVCDEVEGLKELHFGAGAEGQAPEADESNGQAPEA